MPRIKLTKLPEVKEKVQLLRQRAGGLKLGFRSSVCQE